MMAEELVSCQKNEYKATIYGELAEPLLLRSVALLPWFSYEPFKWIRSALAKQPLDLWMLTTEGTQESRVRRRLEGHAEICTLNEYGTIAPRSKLTRSTKTCLEGYEKQVCNKVQNMT